MTLNTNFTLRGNDVQHHHKKAFLPNTFVAGPDGYCSSDRVSNDVSNAWPFRNTVTHQVTQAIPLRESEPFDLVLFPHKVVDEGGTLLPDPGADAKVIDQNNPLIDATEGYRVATEIKDDTDVITDPANIFAIRFTKREIGGSFLINTAVKGKSCSSESDRDVQYAAKAAAIKQEFARQTVRGNPAIHEIAGFDAMIDNLKLGTTAVGGAGLESLDEALCSVHGADATPNAMRIMMSRTGLKQLYSLVRASAGAASFLSFEEEDEEVGKIPHYAGTPIYINDFIDGDSADSITPTTTFYVFDPNRVFAFVDRLDGWKSEEKCADRLSAVRATVSLTIGMASLSDLALTRSALADF